MNIDKSKVLNAKIRLTISELQHIIIALVMAEKASESLSSMEFSKSLEDNGLLEKGRAPYCETCD